MGSFADRRKARGSSYTYPKTKQSYCVLNVSCQSKGGIHSPATLEHIIKLNINFIDTYCKL